MLKLATQTIFKSSSPELKDRKVSDPKVMLKPILAKKKSLGLKLIKVGIGHPPAQTPMSAVEFLWWWGGVGVHSHFRVRPNYIV